MPLRPTRREVLKGGAAIGAGAASGLFSEATLRALAAPPTPGKLTDIEHVVIFINENRSFDHYFGRYPAVRGFNDPHALPGVFAQSDPDNTMPGDVSGTHHVAPYGKFLPFHLDIHAPGGFADCTHDISHEWVAQHHYWNSGAMDQWMLEHNAVDGPAHGFLSMGYYQGAPLRDGTGDIDYFWAVADAFTICDSYFCSVIGPTDPNRLYSMSASIDASGTQGGPSTKTLVSNRNSKYEAYTWATYPEKLQNAGISWKIYQTPDGLYGDNVLTYFKNYQYSHPSPLNPLYVNAFSSQGFPTTSWPTPPRARCPRCPGSSAPWCRASTRPPRRQGVRTPSAPLSTRSRRARCGRRPRCFSPTMKTAASSITLRLRPLRQAHPTNIFPARAYPRAAASPGRSDWAFGCRCSSFRRSAAAALSPVPIPLPLIPPIHTTTPRCCASWRPVSGRRFPTSPHGDEAPLET